jgi:predicted esterase
MSHRFKSLKTYRYFSIPAEKKTKNLLIAMHGYGQLAEYFIRKFNRCSENYTVLAPEGPHRFYKNGYSGRVGASWMTKESREDDIEDNLNWLSEWLIVHLKENTYEKTVLLGFSQGGATAARWYYSQPHLFSHFILWASVFPPDIEKPNTTSGQSYFLVGDKDEFLTSEILEKELLIYQKLGFKTMLFEGNHDIDPKTLNNLLNSF